MNISLIPYDIIRLSLSLPYSLRLLLKLRKRKFQNFVCSFLLVRSFFIVTFQVHAPFFFSFWNMHFKLFLWSAFTAHISFVSTFSLSLSLFYSPLSICETKTETLELTTLEIYECNLTIYRTALFSQHQTELTHNELNSFVFYCCW